MNRLLKYAACLSAALMLLALPSFGQYIVLKVEVPFDFVIGETTLPAGHYDISRSTTARQLLYFQNGDRRTVVMCLTMEGGRAARPGASELVFQRYGAEYFLSQVISAYTWPNARLLMKSARERELLASGQQAEKVIIVNK